ncbi:L-rhamnose mutarotase [Brevundimonas sp.]|uniref:L-rhamnose mutarotase n=1 Tax=Brevundimonas sp. TaxID=1871086 RepID=UPI002ABC509C|nr:L-rhamnose mutarotase [Brevundimonas sp.]MDZ4363708.1 L-rhamnose mutarotase [Brevundimonas sp.]
MPTTRHCYALDLLPDSELQRVYRLWHQPGQTPDAVIRSIRSAGITAMTIHQVGDRLFMIMETDESFSAERKAQADASDPDIRAWETLMDRFQKRIPHAAPGQKWVPAETIFDLADH